MTRRVSILLADDGDAALLTRTLASLQRQDEQDWELVVAGASSERVTALAPDEPEPRLVPVTTPPDAADVGTLLEAARHAAEGEFVGVLAAGDELEPGALRAALLVAHACGGADAVYTDEQWPNSGTDGIATKPDFLPHYLAAYPYMGRLWLVRSELLRHAGGFRSGLGAATEWDAQLRVSELASRIRHAPVVAVTRAATPPTDDPARAALLRAAKDRVERLGRAGYVEPTPVPLGVRTWWTLAEPPLVSIVIPTAGQSREIGGRTDVLIERCVRGLLERTDYQNWEVVLVTSEHTPLDVVARVRTLLGSRLVVVPVTGNFSFSVSVNEGARAARGELLLLLNDDTDPIEPRWLDRMVSVAADPSIGAVGAKLYFEDGTIQHLGITVDDERDPIHPLGSEVDGPGRFGSKVLDTDYLAVTGACLLTRADLFAEVGGFCLDLPLNYNDVDYCLKLQAAGRAVVSTPFATLFHFESSSRGHALEPREQLFLDRHWGLRLTSDPHVEYRYDL